MEIKSKTGNQMHSNSVSTSAYQFVPFRKIFSPRKYKTFYPSAILMSLVD